MLDFFTGMYSSFTTLMAGYGSVILDGAKMTLILSLLSMILAFLIGLLGAAAKLSGIKFLKIWFEIYTTMIRGVPDLVLMMLIFYGLQITLNQITEAFSIEHVDINPFTAGVITLGYIYGAYFTETFRGAFLAVNKGQIEAARAFGFTRWQTFIRIMFPAMMRFALPGIGNNWMVILKATALVSILGLNDLVKNATIAGQSTRNTLFFILVAAFIYLFYTTVSNIVLWWLERKYSAGVRKAHF